MTATASSDQVGRSRSRGTNQRLRGVVVRVQRSCIEPAVVTSDDGALSWDDVYGEFAPALTSYARSRGMRDPEDLAQDVFTAAVTQLGTFDGDRSGLRSLMFSIAYRRVADHHRRRRRRPETLVTDHSPHAAPGPTVEESVGRAETTRQAVAALSVLTDRERDVLTMRIVDEASASEVGAALGLSRGNVRVIQARALAKIRKHLRSIGVDTRAMFGIGVPLCVVEALRTDLPTDGALGGWIDAFRGADPSRSADIAAAAHPAAAGASATAVSWTAKAGSAISSLAASGLGRLGVAASAVAIGGVAMSPIVSSDDPAPVRHPTHSFQAVEDKEVRRVAHTGHAAASTWGGLDSSPPSPVAPDSSPSPPVARATPPGVSVRPDAEVPHPARAPNTERVNDRTADDPSPGPVGDVVDTLVRGTVAPVLDGVKGVVGGTLDGAAKVVDPVVNDIVDPVVNDVLDLAVNDIVDPVVNDVLDPVVKDIVDPVLDDVTDGVDKTLGTATGLLGGVLDP